MLCEEKANHIEKIQFLKTKYQFILERNYQYNKSSTLVHCLLTILFQYILAYETFKITTYSPLNIQGYNQLNKKVTSKFKKVCLVASFGD